MIWSLYKAGIATSVCPSIRRVRHFDLYTLVLSSCANILQDTLALESSHDNPYALLSALKKVS